MRLSSNQSQVILEYFNDDVPVLYFLLNEDGVVMSVNKYCQELLGASVIGLHFEKLLVDFQKSFRLEDSVSKKSEPSLLSINIPNALPRSYLFTFHREKDFILVFGKSDAEELELLRSELISANQELNNLTRSLHKKNAQLAHLNTIKNQFLGMAAHDLRKPISVILNYAEFLIDETGEQLNEEQTSFLSRIENSAFFMKRLVDDFLDVSAIEAGRFNLNIAQVNPNNVLEKSLILARIQASRKDVELEVAVGSNLPDIPLDADKLEQAISNLLGNAIEHSAAGTCVTVSLQEVKGKIVFKVKDRGVGISKEATKKLFIPFSKTGSAKTGGEKSTGLGLTITHKIIEAHHGEIFAESEEGQGTTFTVVLPEEDNG